MTPNNDVLAPTSYDRNRRRGKVWLYRSVLDGDKPLIRDAVLFQVFAYLLTRASWKPRQKYGVELKPGELITSLPKLARELRGKQRTIRDKLAALEKREIIAKRPTKSYTIISVCNWSTYQSHTHRDSAGSREETREALRERSRELEPQHTKKGITKKVNTNSSRRALRFDVADRQFAESMHEKILVRLPKFKTPDLDAWANDICLARERDARTLDDLRAVFEFADGDPFGQANILSPRKLREKFDTLTAKMISTAHECRKPPASPARPRSGEYSDPTRYQSAAARA